MDKISNIIFDLGGIIYDIRYENIGEKLSELSGGNLNGFYTKDFQTREMDLFEMGLMSPEDFRSHIRKVSGIDFSDGEIDEIVNAVLIDVPKERVAMLLALRKKYRVFLLSNTNQINYDCYTRRMREKYGFDVFEECFEACYFSHFMHLRKPNIEGFRRILEERGLRAEETVFIDDLRPNVEGAVRAGLRGICLEEGSVLDLFDEGFNLIMR